MFYKAVQIQKVTQSFDYIHASPDGANLVTIFPGED